MARIRSIHPGFFQSEVSTLAAATQLLFIGLWCIADDWGIFAWEPWKIKTKLSPVQGSIDEIERFLNDLVRMGLVQRFTTETGSYGAIRNFAKYQRPQYPHQSYPCPDSLLTFLGFKPDGTRPREKVRSLNEKMNRPSKIDVTSVSPQYTNVPPDNWKEKQIPSRGEDRYQGIAMRYDLDWDADLD